MLQLLLLSNSTNYGQPYFQWALPYIQDFLKPELQEIIFIPYAAVAFDYNEYEAKVNKAWSNIGRKATGIHHFSDEKAAIEQADAVVVGGGNTWQLLSMIYEKKLLEPIREKVLNGTPYIGWSAGSNLACPTIKTTNDMPVVQPPAFQALNLVPFQINPHYTEATIAGHGGETRAERIKEFITINTTPVIGLPEGCLLKIQNQQIELIGDHVAKIFHLGESIKNISAGDDLQFLL